LTNSVHQSLAKTELKNGATKRVDALGNRLVTFIPTNDSAHSVGNFYSQTKDLTRSCLVAWYKEPTEDDT